MLPGKFESADLQAVPILATSGSCQIAGADEENEVSCRHAAMNLEFSKRLSPFVGKEIAAKKC
jgi:hypothetical protein